MFASFIKEDKIKLKKDKLLDITESEHSDLFMGAFIVFLVEATILFLIMNEMYKPSFQIVKADSFLIIVPRFISSLMMHLSVEPNIRNGLTLMKYALKYPQNFKLIKKEKNKDVNFTGMLFPFFLGFAQASVAFTIEVLVIIYLTSLTNLLAIIMKFMTMAGFIKFGEMYSKALFENKLKRLVDAILDCEPEAKDSVTL